VGITFLQTLYHLLERSYLGLKSSHTSRELAVMWLRVA
jgi:hypothetical protein